MKKILFLCVFSVLSCTFFTSCDDETNGHWVVCPALSSTGLFVLNEGNYYSGINGSLSFLDYTSSTMSHSVFETANQRSLGGTPNDMVVTQPWMYICCTDENRVEIVDAFSGKSKCYVEIPQPRHVCSGLDGVYVSSYDGTVYHISADGNILGQSQVVGACLEGIVADAKYVYVCNAYNPDYTYNTNVVKLDAQTLEKVNDITVACNPTDIKFCYNHLYVLSTGNYSNVQSQIQSIDADDKVTYVCDATHMAVDDTNIYAINSVTDWNTYETKTEYFKINPSTAERSVLISEEDAANIFSPCGLAVDFASQYIYISSYNAGASGYADYSGDGYIMQYDYNGAFIRKYDAGVGPTTMIPFVQISLTEQ